MLILSMSLYVSCSKLGDDDDDDTTTDDTTTTGTGTGGTSGTGGASSGIGGTGSTSVNISGALLLASEALSSASLVSAEAEQYWVKCVTTDITDLKSCIDDVNATTGEFDLLCDGFKQKRFGCFILAGTDETDLAIKGMITSDDLTMGSSTTDASMVINFDPDTGMASVEFEQFVTSSSGVVEEVEVEDIAISVPTELQDLKLTSGNYEVRLCHSTEEKAVEGDFVAAEDTCEEGWDEFFYVNFTEGTETTFPFLEIWRSEEDYKGCHNADGNLEYHISDGTNVLSITNVDNLTHDVFLNKIIDNGWAPEAAIEHYQLSKKDLAQARKEEDAEKDEIVTGLGQLYGAGKECVGIVGDFLTSFDHEDVEVTSVRGKKSCSNVVFKTASTELDAELNKEAEEGGGPIEWCGMWKEADTDEKQEKMKNRFIADCEMHLFGEEGQMEESWAEAELVRSFLEALGQLRHNQGKESRFDEFKDAFKEIDVDALSVDSNTYDEKLIVLAKAWSVVEWDWDLRRVLELAANNIDTTIQTEDYGLKSIDGMTGREFLVEYLQDTNNQQQINSRLCDGEWEIDYMPLVKDTFFAAFMNKVTAEPDWAAGTPAKFTAGAEGVNADVVAFIDDLVASGKLGLCAETHLINDKKCLDGTRDHCFGPNFGEDTAAGLKWLSNQYWPLSEAMLFKTLKDIGAKLADPDQDGNATITADGKPNANYDDAEDDYSALKADLIALGEKYRHYEWFADEIKHRIEQKSEDFGQRLFELTRMISDDIARQNFRFDRDYKETMIKLMKNSMCAPDASISHSPEFDPDSNTLTFPVKVRSPVRRKVAGDVNLTLQLEADAMDESEYQIEDARLSFEGGGQCYWGNIQRLNHLSINTNTFSGVYTEGWVNTCGQGDDAGDEASEEEAEVMMHQSIKATLKTD